MDQMTASCRLVCLGAVVDGSSDLQPGAGQAWTAEFTLGAFVDLCAGDRVSLETAIGVRYPAKVVETENILGPDGCAATIVVVQADLAA
ncbi:MAG: hypothetical protein AB7N24_12510 [Dehalococcoidia bacterium]